MIRQIIGVDCATEGANTGIARGLLRQGGWWVNFAERGNKRQTPSTLLNGFLAHEKATLIALDAPLGWPAELGPALSGHRAGAPISLAADSLFRRATDRFIDQQLAGKKTRIRPFDVGADKIARTAYAALTLIDSLPKKAGGSPSPAWQAGDSNSDCLIEVYPRLTRYAHDGSTRAIKTRSARKRFLGRIAHRLRLAPGVDACSNEHIFDAVLCVLAGIDFLDCDVFLPSEIAGGQGVAEREGFIWVKRFPPTPAGTKKKRIRNGASTKE